ncbi:hypothetical protein GGR32_000130 [Mesonia hippocampi]|uniref:Uncharacterized protein n=1 Tax=Mesonia hippocampi TaxID=1628250 RepID=A0A840EI68_9FLAO|nr:hypothetical protein [Mesonia hippocampi]MBB4117858.1 hypothetical protein [Mesonia hippocampi]
MPFTQQQLQDAIEEAYDAESNNPNINPEQARKRIAQKLASAISSFVIGRQTTGVSSDGASVTTTIQ